MGYTWNNGAVKWLLDKCKEAFLPKEQFAESYLGWGGKDIDDDISPIDAAMSSIHSANRAEFCNPDGVTVEYTRDKGATWTDYGASNRAKVELMSSLDRATSFVLGKTGPGTEKNKDIGLRITLDGGKMGIYAQIKKILINFTSGGAKDCTITFEYSPYNTSEWQFLKTSPISGWPGWNSFTFGRRIGASGYAGRLRMTFYIGGLDDTYSSNATVFNILLLGPNNWGANSTLANTGNIYSYDWQANVTFPADVSAKTFNGKSLDDLGGGKPTIKTNVSVAASAWSSGGTLAGSIRTKYADVPISGVTSNSYVQVAFNPDDCDKYNLAGICKSEEGNIVIYAEIAPSGTITIPTIAIWP